MGQKSSFYKMIRIGDMAADEDSKNIHLFIADFDGVLTSAKLAADASTADRDTNYNTYALINAGSAGTGSTSMATLANGPDSGGVTISATVGGAMTLSSTLANRAFSAGDHIKLTSTKSGSGQAVPGAAIILVGRRDN